MMMFRIGRLNVCSDVRTSRHQPIDRGHHNHRPSGTSPARRTGPGTCKRSSGRFRLPAFERCAVDPDAVQNHGDLPRNGDLCLPHADPLCELHAPSLEGRPFLCSIKQDCRGLEQAGSEKPVAPSRYLTIGISFAGLIPPRCEAQIGTDCRGRSKARRVIDRMTEREDRHDADTQNRHQATRRLVQLCQPANLVIELALLLTHLLVNRQERRYHAEELMVIAQALTNLVAELQPMARGNSNPYSLIRLRSASRYPGEWLRGGISQRGLRGSSSFLPS